MSEHAGLTIRRYQPADAPLVRRLARREFSEYTPGAVGRVLRMTVRASSVVFVAALLEGPVGFVVLDFGPHEGNVDAIVVSPEARGKGIGKALLARVESEARRRGKKELRLVTAEANVAALDLFLRRGFSIAERLRRYYPHGQNAVVMKKTLG